MSPVPATDYSFFGKIKVTGKDRVEVLHNILTQDIEKLSPGQQAPAALLTNTGKILLYMEVFLFEDSIILALENTPASKAIPLIDKYIIAEDIQLADVTSDYAFFQSLSSTPEKFLVSKEQSQDLFQKKGLVVMKREEAEALRIQAGTPLYGVDMDETTILSETGLEKACVSITKGCYPGQEVIAKIETYNGLNRKLMRLTFEGEIMPKAGDKIYSEDGIELGGLTSTAYVKKLNQGFGLGYLKKGFWEEGLKIRAGKDDIQGQLL